MTHNAIRAALSVWLLSAPAFVAAQEPAVYTLPPPRVACDAGTGVVDQSGNVIPGGLRKQCDALWSQSLRNGGVGRWRYEDFISQCARSCAAPQPLSQVSTVRQLDMLGTQAVGGGGGSNTALYAGGGIALAIGIGIAVSQGSSDKPASP
jgi:hypothetical protein